MSQWKVIIKLVVVGGIRPDYYEYYFDHSANKGQQIDILLGNMCR